MTSTDNLIACPQCDALYRIKEPAEGERAVCHRCQTVLIAPRQGAGLKVIALSIASVFLVATALTHPFITISGYGLSHGTTILETALAFSGFYLFLSLTVLSAILVVPLLRMLLVSYVLVPIVGGRKPWPGARAMFRLSEELKPWSMAEIFVIGCAVALVKIAGLAHVELGSAFWVFVGFCILIIVQDTLMCRWTIWKALER